MKTSDLVLDYLFKFGPSRVVDLSAALDLTSADIRYQLKSLISAGMVQSVQSEPGLARGRPAKKFEVISTISTKNMVILLDMFSDQIKLGFPKLSTEEIAGRMWKRVRKILILSHSPYERVTQILNFLDSIGVRTSWEAGKSGPEIKVIQNPYLPKLNPRTLYILADSIVNQALQDAVRG